MHTRVARICGVLLATSLGIAALACDDSQAAAQEAPLDLGAAADFAVLAAATVTNTGPTLINGDLGVSPGTAVTGIPPGTVNGTIHSADATAAQAQTAVTAAYIDGAGRTPAIAVPVELGGTTRPAGVYSGGTLEITGTLTLDAQGDPNAVFIFRAASTLITASNSAVALINGAQPSNVFWLVGSSATLGTGTHFVGTVIAMASITATTGVTVQGRLLARTAAVTLDTNAINVPTRTPATPPTTVPSTPSTTVPDGSAIPCPQPDAPCPPGHLVTWSTIALRVCPYPSSVAGLNPLIRRDLLCGSWGHLGRVTSAVSIGLHALALTPRRRRERGGRLLPLASRVSSDRSQG